MGYEFDMPVLRKVDDVPVKQDAEAEQLVLTADEVDDAQKSVAVDNQTKNDDATEAVVGGSEETAHDSPAAPKRKKITKEPKKKAKKARVSV